ncbi:phosphoribosylanthranilate isomerase [Glaciibacter psychrotolerans]|uniref:N-(5'-phosphoribosyl)anthranilate isomerase n=1 Tax=Glaciibacter psychrotolerans TaxID=670054 RepID=A0A7Z0EBY5_9MICO|nr:phosphoribosylanthranilate isomerase [Leifsonia psychrotolerans]NYJ18703.1 phosphoribosylanthranilate isomerase [Leifsonia psychrotolerans]
MSQVYVKVCGISTAAAAQAVVDSGADAIGFVFAPGSPRLVSVEHAAGLAADLPVSIETVGVFRNQPLDLVLSSASQAGLTTVQLHGDEPDDHFDRLRDEGFRTIRALSIDRYREGAGSMRLGEDRVLIDAVTPGAGTTFDTTDLENRPPHGFWLLAGGLAPDNVAGLVRAVRPGGVDVSSGVESSRGVKDSGLIRAFVAAARQA